MDWKLLDENGEFIQEANCQYDALDLAVMFFNAKKVEIDFVQKEAKVISRA